MTEDTKDGERETEDVEAHRKVRRVQTLTFMIAEFFSMGRSCETCISGLRGFKQLGGLEGINSLTTRTREVSI